MQANHFLSKLDTVKGQSSSDVKLSASSHEEGKPDAKWDDPEPFDAVILTMPLPQIMKVPGAVQDYLGM